MTEQAAETPAPERKPLTYGDLMNEREVIHARLMKCSKECLALALSSIIGQRGFFLHGADDKGRTAYYAEEITEVERWRGIARMANRTKRMKAFLERLENPKPRRRRRRKRRAA
ncbi:hypothetical protein [Dongia deserti]|uniref:hypothetical protein n=1 Tax=Dongia deserti TaxID=2268030 RepID=UPI000E65A460|nr:hypothetical protein [Dongia deserti]